MVQFVQADKIQFVEGLPKTRSGKIMRRILRKIACGKTHSLGDTSTLLDSFNSLIKLNQIENNYLDYILLQRVR